jgi:hypothetical protein
LPKSPTDYVPVAEEIEAHARHVAIVYSAANAYFSRQLLALIDANTPRRFVDLAQQWEIEALR